MRLRMTHVCNTHALTERQDAATQNSAMLQIVDRLVDLLEPVAIRDQLTQLELTLAVPANEDGKIALRLTVSAARAGKRTVTNEQTGI